MTGNTDLSRGTVDQLTQRETEVLELVQRGLLSKEISTFLRISIHTVNTHRQNILVKLGANNSFEAILMARQKGVLM